jgi:predicted Fe-S protein YdhL (DUF1289 family)
MTSSPCESTCVLNTEHTHCEKCGREINDIQEWLNYPEEKRKQIMKQIKQKRKAK